MTPRPRKLHVSRRRPQVYTLRVTLRGVEPPVWRQLLVRDDTSLATLHELLQDVVGWQNYHLWEFKIGSERYEAPDPEATGHDATTVTLQELELKSGTAFEYSYDPGDDWLHDITVEAITPVDPELAYPVCTAGARACPPEASGGPDRYSEMLDILKDPEHADFAEVADWISDSFHPDGFDLRATNRILMLAYGGGGAV